MRLSKILTAAAMVALWSGAASAASVYFNTYQSWNSGENSYTGSDGTTVSLNGVTHSNGNIYQAGDSSVYTASWSGSNGGAGACSHLSWYGCAENHTVDGYGPDEGLLVHFNENVQITSLVFSYVDYNDEVSIYSYDNEPFPLTLDTPANSATSFIGSDQIELDPYDFSHMVGQYFLVGASDYNDDWKLKGIHYEIAPVPLPAAGFMLLAGLGGLAVMRRRQKATAA